MKTLTIFVFAFAINYSALSQSWLTSGNTGTVPGTNFIGTTDAKDFVFKTNSTEKGRVKSNGLWQFGASGNLAKIDSAGNLSFAGTAGYKVGGNKYAFQYSANPNYGLFFNLTGLQYEFRTSTALSVFSIGVNNGNGIFKGTLKVGAYTLPSTDGTNGQVLKSNGAGILTWQNDNSGGTVGWDLTGNAGTNAAINFIGTTDNTSLVFKTNNIISGVVDPDFPYNTSLGFNTLLSNSSGTENVSIGSSSMYANTSGYNNTAIGATALNSNVDGYFNTAVGHSALVSNISGYKNTAIGNNALATQTLTNNNTAIGYGSLSISTYGWDNVAAGINSLYLNSGSYCVAIGTEALYSNAHDDNIAIGYRAMKNNSSGTSNIGIGSNSLLSNISGGANVAVGIESMRYNYDGQNNVAVGGRSLYYNLTGDGNAGIGYDALYLNTGDFNTAVGENALNTNTSGYNNTSVGYNSDVASGSLNNSTAIGYNAFVDATNKMRFGNSFVSSIGGQVGWSNFSDKRIKDQVIENVPGLAFINYLRPVTFHYNIQKQNEIMGISDTANWEGKNGIEKIQFTGFIAQEVENAANKIGFDFSGVDKSGTLFGLRYAEFVVPLVQAVQELDSMNYRKDEKINELQTILESQKQQLNLLNQKIEMLSAMSFSNKQTSHDGAVNISIGENEEALLCQNIPNPFDNSTVIPFRIPKNCNDASIVVTETSTGRIVTALPISCSETHAVIEAGKLSAGNYTYTLYVDGKLIDTKNMVLTKD